MGPIAILYALTTIVFGVLIITDFIKSKHLRWRFSGIAFKYALTLTLMNVLGSTWTLWITEQGPDFLRALLSALLQFPLLYMYISVGVRYARKLELPGALFWKRLSFVPFSIDDKDDRVNKVHGINTEIGQMLYTSAIHPEYIQVQSMHSEMTDHLNRKWWIKFDAIVVISVIIASIYTIVLFSLTQPQASEMIRLIQESSQTQGTETMNVILLAIVFARLAAAEEIFFRLVVQTVVEWKFRASRYASAIAILFSSLFWSIGHVGVLVPEWVKLAQIFPFGIALGLIYRRYGIEAAILIHVVFNIAMIFLSPGFVSI